MKRLTIAAVIIMAAATGASAQSTGSGSVYDPWLDFWSARASRAWANAWSGTQPTREYHRVLREARNPTYTVHRLHGRYVAEHDPNRGTNERSRLTREPNWRRELVLADVMAGRKPKPAAIFFNPKPREDRDDH